MLWMRLTILKAFADMMSSCHTGALYKIIDCVILVYSSRLASLGPPIFGISRAKARTVLPKCLTLGANSLKWECHQLSNWRPRYFNRVPSNIYLTLNADIKKSEINLKSFNGKSYFLFNSSVIKVQSFSKHCKVFLLSIFAI